MVQFARSLLSWLAASGQTTSAGPTVVSCTATTIALAEGSSLKAGDIFIRVDAESLDSTGRLCRDDCGVLFREILSDEGNGVYTTAPASFAQVFPSDTFDYSQRDTPVEAVLPSCDHEYARAERELIGFGSWLSPNAAPAAAPETEESLAVAEARKDHYDDDEDDDKYVEEKDDCSAFWDATKKFIFDMYCIIRALDCTDYNPGQDDYVADDDYSGSKDKHRTLSQASKPQRRMRGVKKSTRALQDTDTETAAETAQGVSTVVTIESSSSGNKGSSSKDEYDDDDFFDDDDTYTDDGGQNFWKILDAVFEYIGSLMCIFGGKCKEETYDDDAYYDDDCDDKKGCNSKDKHIRALVEIQEPPQYTSWWSNIFAQEESQDLLFKPVPTSLEHWMTLDQDGTCAYSKCRDVNSSEQCFEKQSPVADTCRHSLDQWFALPAKGQDNVLTWNMDAVCHGQDFCYASNIFEQTQCDEQFYRSLLQACPETSVTMSSHAPLVTDDLYEHCPLVSILLYSQMQLKSDDLYEAAKENQSLFEATGCR